MGERSGTDKVWSEEKCITLIRHYKARPVLWDTQHEQYYKKELKQQMWREIGQILNLPPNTCRRKIMVLLSSLRREKSKIRHSKRLIASGMSSLKEYQSRWFAFKEMGFILEKEKERKRQAAARYLVGNAEEQAGTDSETDDLQPSLQTLAKESNNSTEPGDQASSSKPIKVTMAAKSCKRSDDEVETFTRFIAMKMSKYSERTKNEMQQAICEIIFKADRQSYAERDAIVNAIGDSVYVDDGTMSTGESIIKLEPSDDELDTLNIKDHNMVSE